MMKIALLSCFVITLFTIATARPGYLHGHHHIDYPLIHHVPAAVSHQSSTVIHTAPIIKPVIVPVVKHVVHPVIKAYHPLPLHFDPYHHFDHHDFHHYH